MIAKEYAEYCFSCMLEIRRDSNTEHLLAAGFETLYKSNLAILEAIESQKQAGQVWVIAEDGTPVSTLGAAKVEIEWSGTELYREYWVEVVYADKSREQISRSNLSKARAEFLREHLGQLLTGVLPMDRNIPDLRVLLAEWDAQHP